MSRRKTISLHSPGPDSISLPECPEWMGKHGMAKWQETVDILVAADPHRIQPIDGDFLAMYCDAFDELHAALVKIEELGDNIDCLGTNGSMYPHPVIARKNKAKETIRKFGRELGLNYASRKSKKSAPLKPHVPARIKPA